MNDATTVIVDGATWCAWLDTGPEGMPRVNVTKDGVPVYVRWDRSTLHGRQSQPIPSELTEAFREALNGGRS